MPWARADQATRVSVIGPLLDVADLTYEVAVWTEQVPSANQCKTPA